MSFLSYKISSGIKLPYSTIRGSISSRTNKSEISTEKLYEQLISITDGKSCLVQDFKSCIEKFLEPNKVEISVLHNSFKDADAAISIDSTLNNLGAKGEYKYQGYIFYFPLNSDKDKIVDIHSFRHELRHFFDYLYHPKTVSSNVIYDKIYIYDLSLMAFKYTKNILGLKSIATNVRNQFLNAKIFDFMPKYFRKKSIKKELNKLPKEYVVPLLQDIRYSIISEINAYNETKKGYINKPVTNLTSFSMERVINLLNKRYVEKNALIEELLKEYITKERLVHKVNTVVKTQGLNKQILNDLELT